jgi:hypothetical protein
MGFQICNLRSSNCNRNDFSAHASAFYDQSANRHGQLEASWPGATGIEVQHAVTHLLLRNVAVARDHNLESCGFRLQFEVRQIVQHVDGNAGDLDDFIFRKFTSPRPFVDIAGDGSEGCKVCQLLEDFWRANVAGVDDVLRASQCQ